MTVLVAVSDQVDALYHEIAWGGVGAERFRTLIENISVILADEPATIIMDNAPARRGTETVSTS